MAKRLVPIDVFAHVNTRDLPPSRRAKLREAYVAGNHFAVFPAGSSAIPALLVGRERQMAQLANLARELFQDGGDASRPLLGVVLHGPRGTGKTALLEAFAQGAAGAGAHVIGMTGNNSLNSKEDLIGELARQAPPARAEQRTSEWSAGVDLLGVSGSLRRTRAGREAAGGGPISVHEALRQAIACGPKDPSPVLATVDEAHAADPETLGMLLNATQSLGGPASNLPVALALAGTPDLIDVLRDANATWFLDRAGLGQRLAPMPNDLAPEACARALSVTLEAAGVAVRDDGGLAAAAAACKGSPYFLQVLGKSTLEFAAHNGDVADFSPEGETATAFREAANARYAEAWSDLDRQGLAGCARQLGALWRARGEGQNRRPITDGLVVKAIESGLDHAPAIRREQALPSAEEAESRFKRLGLLWSPTGTQDAPWSLGLPSFFDHVEARFRNPDNPSHHAALPALEAAMQALVGDRQSQRDPLADLAGSRQ